MVHSEVAERVTTGPAGPLDQAGIVGVGTAAPETSYTQQELLDLFEIDDERVRSLFHNGSIERRHLHLPPPAPDGGLVVESQADLLAKHCNDGIELGGRALRATVESAGRDLADIGYLCCVSSTGWLTPGFSARLIQRLGLDPRCGRLDVVGMGCNAGLNGLAATSGWAAAHPGRMAVLLCVEVCSAAYVFDGSMRTAVVNSLFGDGAAGLAMVAGPEPGGGHPQVRDFASVMIPEAIEAMRYDWDEKAGKFSFFLDREIPYVVGAHVEEVVDRLLDANGLRRSDIAHWTVHSGGKKVVDAIKINLGLTDYDLRHTTGVLRDYGNLSSGSFLFSYQRLLEDRVAAPGDWGVFMTMGPGSTIETALVRW